MATQVHQNTTRPIVNTDSVLTTGHRDEVIVFGGPTGGSQANAWSAAAVGAGGTSTALDAQFTPLVSVFGNASAPTTISLEFSQDNTNWYDVNQAGYSIATAGDGDFALTVWVAARYVRMKSSAAATITATIAGKGS